MYCRPKKVLPAIVCPTKCCVNHNFENLVQPVIHPSHTTNVNHTNIQQQHFFPHTESVVNEVTEQNLGPAPYPMPYPGPGMGMGPGGYPGSVAGAMSGPGMGMGPGGYPGSVAGAMSGPGMGMGPGMGPKGRRFWR